MLFIDAVIAIITGIAFAILLLNGVNRGYREVKKHHLFVKVYKQSHKEHLK